MPLSAKPDLADPDLPKESDLFSDSESESLSASLPPARNQAMNWLARREYSRAELADKLAAKGYSPEDIQTAVAGLVADNLVCDERFAEALIAVRIRKGQGPVRIRMELKKRGVNSDTIRLHLDDAGHDWKGLALEVRQRKYGGALPAEYKEKARQMRFLEYRGFSSEHIRAALGDDFDRKQWTHLKYARNFLITLRLMATR